MSLLLLLNGDVAPPTPVVPPIESTGVFLVSDCDCACLVVRLEETAYTIPTEVLEFEPNSIAMTIEGNDIRVSWDGSLPTEVEGHLFYSFGYYPFTNFRNVEKFSMFSTGSSKVTITLEGA